MHKQIEKAKKILCRFFLIVVVVGLVGNIILPDKDMSALENRSLAKFPTQIN